MDDNKSKNYFLLTVEKFAAHVGVTVDTVNGWIKTNQIPTIKIGKRRLINMYKVNHKLGSDFIKSLMN